jgi:hypothetical protein
VNAIAGSSRTEQSSANQSRRTQNG